jgi:hypothetical protein
MTNWSAEAKACILRRERARRRSDIGMGASSYRADHNKALGMRRHPGVEDEHLLIDLRALAWSSVTIGNRRRDVK